MIKKIISVLLLFPFCLWAQEGNPPSAPIDYEKLSATLGHLIVRQLKQPGFSFNLDQVIQGMQDESNGLPAPMTEEEYELAVYALQEQNFLQTAEQNLSQATSFLKDNATKEGVQELEAKLQYLVAQEGNGEAVGPESVPLIHYKGCLLDGTVFASSQEANQPVALPIKQSIPGFAKGLVGMKEGEKRVLYIHPELAYGVSGHLPPNSLLIFEVEIVKANSISLADVVQAQQALEPKR